MKRGGIWANRPDPRICAMANRSARWIWLAVAATFFGALVVYLISYFPEAVAVRDGQIGLTHGLIFFAVLGGSAILYGRNGPGNVLRYAAIWIVAAVTVLGAYSFRHDAARFGEWLLGELVPHRGIVRDGVVTVRAGLGGHFVVEIEVNGIAIRFLVDTGASDVILSPADAVRLGFNLSELRYIRTYRTPNGLVLGAPVRLDRVAVGSIVLTNVGASVNGAPMRRSLLGMSFLSRLSGYEVRDNKLILKP